MPIRRHTNSKKTISVVNVKFYDEVIKNRININKNVDESLYNKAGKILKKSFKDIAPNLSKVEINKLVQNCSNMLKISNQDFEFIFDLSKNELNSLIHLVANV